jgi:hypothetical protein
MIEIFPPMGKYKYDTWRIVSVKCYINNSMRLRSCIRNVNIGFVLTQASYARKILKKAGMVDCNPCKAPMEPRLKLSKESTSPPPLVDATFYRSLVGSLRYLVNTRPGIVFAVGYVSRFM